MSENENPARCTIKENTDSCCLLKRQENKSEPHIQLSKYYLFFFDLFTWKYPRNSGTVLGSIVALLLFSSTVNIPHLFLHTAWIIFASSTIIEVTGRSIFKQPNGFISQFAPSSFYFISRESLNNIVDKICDLINFILYEIQELLFAKKIKHTAIAFSISWISFVLIQFFSFIHILLLATLLIFTIPSFYIKYQETIDKYFTYVFKFTNNYSNIIKKHARECAEKAVKELSSSFMKLGTKINSDIDKFKNGFIKNKSLLNLRLKKTKSTLSAKTSVPEVSTTQEVLNEGIEKYDTNTSIAA
ncbi:hypothetical protein PORY_000535 [Pneumocystis oryctolagi]|uniref:Uncharacterized protein n=1 Tax=Pneumocystis oryctolagi TaxID=42067 RepID=A0ACB7CGZ3_9ASCO|nr:hypothetical protein PORY_000535 [Pneumocystis oryctolagi]